MALSRASKTEKVKQLATELEHSTSAIIGTFKGLTAAKDFELRRLIVARKGERPPLQLEDHAVRVQLREDDRDLPLPEGVVERVVDRLERDPEARCRVAVDDDLRLEPLVLLVARHVP